MKSQHFFRYLQRLSQKPPSPYRLLDVIDSEFNEKRIYAMGQLIKHMCKDEVFGIKRYGTAEKIKAATAESLCKAWQNLLKTAKFENSFFGFFKIFALNTAVDIHYTLD